MDTGLLDWEATEGSTINKDTLWDLRYQMVVQYGQIYGTCNVPYNYVTTPSKLTNALHELYIQQQAHSLPLAFSADSVEARAGVGADSALPSGGMGHPIGVPRVPSLIKDQEQGMELPVQLGFWVSQQRSSQRRGTLSPDKHDRLQQLVDRYLFTWNVNESILNPKHQDWERKYRLLGKE